MSVHIVLLTVSFRTIKAAMANPVKTLRTELKKLLFRIKRITNLND